MTEFPKYPNGMNGRLNSNRTSNAGQKQGNQGAKAGKDDTTPKPEAPRNDAASLKSPDEVFTQMDANGSSIRSAIQGTASVNQHLRNFGSVVNQFSAEIQELNPNLSDKAVEMLAIQAVNTWMNNESM